MKNKKRFAILLAVTMLLALFTACSGNAGTSQSSQPSAPTENNSSAASGTSDGTNWPAKPVTIIVPYNAGGDSDFNARLLAEKLSTKTGQNFVVQNVAGNSGATGSRQALSADPDGYTILFNHTAYAINYFAGNSDLTYDDMTFGAIVGLFPVESDIIAAQPSFGISKLSELRDYTKDHPGELIYGASSGTTVLVSGMRMQDAGIDITMVDTGGTAERMTAILGGHVDFTCVPRGNAQDYLTTGELIEVENDLGTEIICPAYYQMNFPKNTDPAIVEKLNTLLEDIISNDSDYATRIHDAYEQVPFYRNSEEGKALMMDMWDDFSKWNWG